MSNIMEWEELHLHIDQKVTEKMVKNKKHSTISYPVFLNKEKIDEFSKKEIDKLKKDSESLSDTLNSFQEIIEKKKFYKIIHSFLEKYEDQKILFSIQSEDSQIVSWPWQIFLQPNKQFSKKRLNVIIRRTREDIKNGDFQINLEKQKILLTSFSKLKQLYPSPSVFGKSNIVGGVCDEIKELDKLFPKDLLIFGETTKETVNNLKENYSFLHYAGHGNIETIELSDDFIADATMLKDIEAELCFLNSCFSGKSTSKTSGLCYNLIMLNKKTRFVIGMLGSVEDGYAMEFSQNFYNKLKESNGNVLEALLCAQKNTKPTGNRLDLLIPMFFQK